MVDMPLMLGLAVAILGLGYCVLQIRDYGLRWPTKSVIIAGIGALIAFGLLVSVTLTRPHHHPQLTYLLPDHASISIMASSAIRRAIGE